MLANVLAACKILASADAHVILQYFNEAAQMVEHVHRGNGYYLTPRVRARRDARDARTTSLRRQGCPVQLSQRCAGRRAPLFTMAKRKHKDSTAR